MRRSVLILVCVFLASCSDVSPVFHQQDPTLLSEWQLLTRSGDTLQTSSGVHVYFLNSSLFTDYAHKLRTVTLPEGTVASFNADGTMQFPVGAIISKTFYYPRGRAGVKKVVDRGQYVSSGGQLDLNQVRLIETRLLVHRADGWVALPYVWNESQTEATLQVTGDIQQHTLVDEASAVTFNYLVPDQNQCAGCHGTDTSGDGINPIGPKFANLNAGRADIRPGQLAQFVEDGWLTFAGFEGERPSLTNWQNQSANIESRARAYLEINCGHCHSEQGPADTSGLFLDVSETNPTRLGTCKLPIAAGQGTGGHLYSIVPGSADTSIMVYRMDATDPGAMMPELGRSLVHKEGVALVSQWINQMPGSCDGS